MIVLLWGGKPIRRSTTQCIFHGFLKKLNLQVGLSSSVTLGGSFNLKQTRNFLVGSVVSWQLAISLCAPSHVKQPIKQINGQKSSSRRTQKSVEQTLFWTWKLSIIPKKTFNLKVSNNLKQSTMFNAAISESHNFFRWIVDRLPTNGSVKQPVHRCTVEETILMSSVYKRGFTL